MMENPQAEAKRILDETPIKIESDLMQAKINSLVWKIRPDGATKTVRDKIINISDDYETAMKDLINRDAPSKERYALVEDTNKKICELALLGFSYDDAANNPEAGPVAIDAMTQELRTFLVDNGGRVGTRHSQMLSNLINLLASHGMKDSSKSTQSGEPTSGPTSA